MNVPANRSPCSPSRAAGLARLDAFVPRAGRDYARLRNVDHGPGANPHVSGLSPYLRHRLVTEEEVLRSVLARHSATAAEKFVQEVFWRGYWKGWLEMRPAVWDLYRQGLDAALARTKTEDGLRRRWSDACAGRTGIEGFDHWARELTATGYLHNHARMWFASIWIFTLDLPWELGADFFLRHLLDGDPASNTLGWRWVAGLQTPGKTYLARPDNIAKFTGGRFRPRGLATDAPPCAGAPPPAPGPAPAPAAWAPGPRDGLLLHEDDLAPGFLFAAGLRPVAQARLQATGGRSPLAVSEMVRDFAGGALDDAAMRCRDRAGTDGGRFDAVAPLVDWAVSAGLDRVVTPHAPVGPAAAALDRLQQDLSAQGIALVRVPRPYDLRAWPLATHGFFRFRKSIPDLLTAMGL